MRLSGRVVLFAAAAAAAGGLIAASLLGGRDDGDSGRPATAPASGLLEGVPQQGTVLGDPDAPFRLVEYADLQCPFCAEFALETLPTLVDEYVRPGRLSIELRGLAFLGPDSVEALQAALAAAEQDRMWNVVERLFASQGAENSGWVTPELLRQIGGEVAGLDVERMLTPRASVDAAMRRAAEQAEADGVQGTPFFTIAAAGETSFALPVASLDVAAFREALEGVLAG